MLTVNGAGHMVPIAKPAVARQILRDFISSDKNFCGINNNPAIDHYLTTC